MKTFVLTLLAVLFIIHPTLCATELSAPKTCKAKEKILIKVSTDNELPASSFYRVDISCPKGPTGAGVEVLSGWPESEMRFPETGVYECEAEIGIVTKQSCAGAKYAKLGTHKFAIEVLP